MFRTNNVRAQINQHSSSQPFSDSRLQSNPQPIPQNSGNLNPLQRGPSAVPRNFSPYSPAQSPRHAPYMLNVNPSDINASSSSMIARSPSTKPSSNGQHMWSMQQQVQYQQQHSQPQNVFPGNPNMASKFPRPHQSSVPYQQNLVTNTAAMVTPGTPQLFYDPGTAHMRPTSARFTTNSNSPMLAQSGQTSNFYSPGQPPFFPNQVPQLPGYAPGSQYDHNMQFQPSNRHHHPFPPPNMMQSQTMQQMPMQQPQQPPVIQQQMPQPPPPSRKGITIKDPNTMEDVTKTILQSGRQSELEPGVSRAPILAFQQQQQQPQQQQPQQTKIAVQFAASVAALAASGSPERHPHANAPPLAVASGQGDVSSHRIPHPMKSVSPSDAAMIPSGLDTSVPPPSLKAIHPQMTPPQTSVLRHGQNPPRIPMQTTSYNIVPPDLLSTSPAQNPMQSGSAIHPPANVPAFLDISLVVQPPLSANQVNSSEKRLSSNPAECDSGVSSFVEEAIPDLNEDTKNLVLTQAKQTDDAVELTAPSDVDAATHPRADETVSEQDVVTSVTTDVTTLSVEDESRAAESVEAIPEDLVGSSANIESPPGESNAKVLDEQGDVVCVEAAKDESEVDQLTENPLSSGDSALKETNDRVLRKSPEGEESPEQDKNGIINKNLTGSSPSIETTSTDESPSYVDNDVIDADIEVKANDPTDDLPNLSGKKVYARDFLLQFRFHSSSMTKPADLPHIEDIIRDSPLPKSSISSNLPSVGYSYPQSADFTPNWMRGAGPRGGRQSSRGARPGPQRPGYGMGYHSHSGPPKIITKSIQKEPELSKAENAWKPSKLETKATKAVLTEEEQTEEVLRNVRAILNKLTPQKFQALLQKFQQLPINSELRLIEVTNLIFEKAIDEPSFCEAYANMCRVMSQFKVSAKVATAAQAAAAGPQSTVEFRKVLLTRCQREFEKDRANESILGDLRKKVEEAKTPEEKQQLKEELDYKETKERRRMLGNIRFIGELFKLQMLTETIMHNCLMSLFRKRDDESLESLCRLLMTIGKDLDHDKGKARMDQYFAQIEKIISEKKTSSRVRFMLKDVVDLRLKKWVPRAIQAQGPKTIDQIHQDAKEEKEQLALQQAAAAAAPPVKSQSRGNRMGSRGGGGHNSNDEGWTKVQQKPIRIDPSKMKLSKYDESMTLGPNRGKVGWKSGSGSGATRTGSGGYSNREALEGITPRSSTPTTMNRFSALGMGPSDFQRSGRISSQERTKNDSRGSTGSGRGAVRDDRQYSYSAVRKMTSTERKPFMNRDSKDRTSGKAPSPSPSVKVDVEAVNKKLSGTIKEYLFLHDIKEASECFDELKLPPTHLYLIVQICIEASLEKSSSDRLNVARLLSALVRQDKVPPEQYVTGVVNNMELAVELEIDLPKIWSCLAELLSPVFYDSNGKVPLVFLKKLTSPLLKSGKANVLVAEILKFLIKEKGPNEVLQHWRANQLTMSDFMSSHDSADVVEFLKRHDLAAFHSDASSSRFNFFRSNISKQLTSNVPNKVMHDWILRNVSQDSEAERVTLVRALTTAAFEFAISKKGPETSEFNKDLLASRLQLLKNFISNEALELEAVYALQRLYVQLEQPANLLKLIFDHVYEVDLISDQAFFKWETDTNPQELEGRGVTLLSVNSFLRWLHEPENESDE